MEGQDQRGHEGEGELAIIISSNGEAPEVNGDKNPKKMSSSKESWPASPDISEDEPSKNKPVIEDHIGPSYSHDWGSPGDQDDDNNEEIYEKVKLRRRKQKIVKAGIFIEWIASLCILGCFVASLTVEELRKTVIWKLKFWKWCMLMMVIFCGMLATSWFLRFIGFINRRNYKMRINDLPFVHCLKRSVQVFIWIGLVLLVWVCLINRGIERSESAKKILKLITWTLVALLVGTFLWLLKTVLLEVTSSKFRVDAFFDRMQQSSFQAYILETLLGPPLTELSSAGGSSTYAKKERVKNKKLILKELHKMEKEEISSRIMNVWVERVINGAFHDQDDEITGVVIRSETEAIAAAYKIFRNVAQPACKYISEDDLRRFFPREELHVVFAMFDGWQTGHIDRKSLADWVVRVYQERRRLAFTLDDTRAAIKQLNKVMSVIVVVVTIIIWLLLIKITTSETIAIFLTAAAFAFGNTFKTIFEASVFIFAVHPFDIGDRCVVDGVPLVVEEMDILTTVFLKLDNEKIYYPNSVLATKPISNYYRSPDMGESVEFAIDFTAPLKKISVLKARIKQYLETNPVYWRPNHSVVLKETESNSKLKMIIHCNHTMNFQNFGEKNKRRTELILELKKIFEELDIQS
ncbi:hypothetical protein K2173_009395 [Erythroxylum novogranatense]|uniref:EF-hand domain-containing protein n=1 Tax=Erythroxylum novogranatense TaxID=1862640 RepID=A0AAV8U710_9ROSI|nr:hypothetical protein K2173_009395 [Erythroxylum novogranatense]